MVFVTINRIPDFFSASRQI